MASIDTTTLPDLLSRLRALNGNAPISRVRVDGFEVDFAVPDAIPPEPRLRAGDTPVTDPDKAPIHPLDAVLNPPTLAVPKAE